MIWSKEIFLTIPIIYIYIYILLITQQILLQLAFFIRNPFCFTGHISLPVTDLKPYACTFTSHRRIIFISHYFWLLSIVFNNKCTWILFGYWVINSLFLLFLCSTYFFSRSCCSKIYVSSHKTCKLAVKHYTTIWFI